MLQHSLIQPDFNKGQATPADSPWCSNSQRKLGRSVVYEYRGEKSLRWSNCLRVTQYIIRLWTTWTSSILYHRTDQPVALEPCAVHKWFNPAPTSGQHGLPRAGLRNAFLLLWISGCRQQGCTRSPHPTKALILGGAEQMPGLTLPITLSGHTHTHVPWLPATKTCCYRNY